MHPLSIKTKIRAVTTLSIFLVAALLGGVYVYDETGRIREFEQRILNDSVRSAATISYTIMPSLIEKDFVRMSNLVSYYSMRSDRLYVAIVDNDNRIMAHSAGDEIGASFEPPAVFETEKIRGGVVRKYLRAGDKSIEVSYPVKAGDLVLGSVRIGVNTDWLRNETGKIRSTILISLAAAFAIVSLGILIASAIARRISEPILLLKEAAERIGRGDYDHRVDIKSNDEIGVLAEAFNRMAGDLRDSRTNLVEKEALRTSEARLKEAQQIARIGHWEWDIVTNKVDWSDELYRIYGYEPGEIVPDYGLVVEAMHPATREEFFRAIYAALRGERPYEMDYVFFRKDGSEAILHAIGRVLYDENGAPWRMVGTVQDITTQRRAEEAIKESENLLQTIIDTEPECVKLLSLDGKLIHMNPAGLAMVEADALDQLKGHPVAGLVLPEYRQAFKSLIEKNFEGVSGELEFEVVGLKGKCLWLETHAVPLRNAKGEIFASLGITRDITERKRAEERILSALAEKEILLKEIHHRVKNNLQVVASLLDLQSQTIEDEQTRLLFGESQKRIEAISLIHEKLYRSKNLARIDFKEYVDDLTANVFALHADAKEEIRLETDIPGVALDVVKAIPCGLIVNELVTNAIRHAFADGRRGTLSVRMHSASDGIVTLSVRDDGVGFPADMDFKNTKSLGMQLVNLLVDQLGGAIELQRGTGTAFTITFQGENGNGRM